jgi:nitroreductase/FMN reductase [NAD(P)H]
MKPSLQDALSRRFLDAGDVPQNLKDNPTLTAIASRGSCRWFREEPVPVETLRTLCTIALAAPSKSDLQQRDVVIVSDLALKAKLTALVPEQDWIKGAPNLLVICANNRRQRQLHELHDRSFVNDHLDAFFNASVDAGILLSTLVITAEAAGLGCCPISALRNRSKEVCDLLNLPDYVFPIAGLAIGHPKHETPRVSPRLSIETTVHVDQFSDADIAAHVADYDAHRQAVHPYKAQRNTDLFGTAETYSWSEEKTRQYGVPERADFGAFIKAHGFNLD